MGRRLELHQILNSIQGVKKAYFQPPESEKLEYPCVIYHLQTVDMVNAGDYPYKNRDCYHIMVIDRNPDSEIRRFFESSQLCRFDRFYAVDGLNHWSYIMYY